MNLKPSALFLIDACGALLSAFSLGVVLVYFEAYIGMPRETLYLLALVAACLAVYSSTCYLTKPKNWRPFLAVIAIANLIYCCLTVGVVVNLYRQLTQLGLLYFGLEVVVILVLVGIELKTVFRNKV